MKDLSLHILDLSQNSISAGAGLVKITVNEDYKKDTLTISIEDDGKGIQKDLLKNIMDPFVTTRTSRKVGLGDTAYAGGMQGGARGSAIESEENVGTSLLQHSGMDISTELQ